MGYVFAALVIVGLIVVLAKHVRDSRRGERSHGGGGGDGKPRQPY